MTETKRRRVKCLKANRVKTVKTVDDNNINEDVIKEVTDFDWDLHDDDNSIGEFVTLLLMSLNNENKNMNLVDLVSISTTCWHLCQVRFKAALLHVVTTIFGTQ